MNVLFIANNTALATVIAAGLAILIGQILTIIVNRTSNILDAAAQGGNKVVTANQKTADALPNNPDVIAATPAIVAAIKQSDPSATGASVVR